MQYPAAACKLIENDYVFSFREKFGPGFMFALAVGISHLVQSTHAGADYGLPLRLLKFFECKMTHSTPIHFSKRLLMQPKSGYSLQGLS